ncbi:nucleolar protein dao-5-like isoform X5 [Camellia sinensis]|uniref:nucleolar protein dao-5-like isoform X5 n=1 Tax=Camellia sinensis TaxID=4442 RepID=UPI0010361D04|nr:nucleolar protein dao-5-like isoform X5 [Camellia sinensis]
MRGYDRDDYEDLDEYEEDGDKQEEEGIGEGEYEEEPPQTTQEELEYLELRQRLKEGIRKQMKKESGSALANSQEKKKRLPFDNFGSFFGPSQPVIAQRVIEESKSFLENQHLTAKVSKSHHDVGTIKKKSFASTTGGSKSQVPNHRPKVVNQQVKMKVQKLKDMRDYSFLVSDDAALPAPAKDPPIRNVAVTNSDARSAQVPPKSKQWSTNTARQFPNSCERKPVSTSSQMHPKAGSHKSTSTSKPILTSVYSRKQLGNNNGSGPGRPLGPKCLPSKVPAAATERRVSASGSKSARSSTPSVHKPPSSKLHLSAPKQPSVPKQPLELKKAIQGSSKGKMLPKQPVPFSKPQINKPLVRPPSRPTVREDRPKKQPVRPYFDDDEDEDDDDDEGGRAISMIRSIIQTNLPNVIMMMIVTWRQTSMIL